MFHSKRSSINFHLSSNKALGEHIQTYTVVLTEAEVHVKNYS